MQHIVVLSIDSGDPSVTDFHHGLLESGDVEQEEEPSQPLL